MKFSRGFFCFLMLFSVTLYGQVKDFSYKRKIIRVKGEWQRLELPNEIFGKLNSDYSDIRVLGVSSEGDSVEAPYLLNKALRLNEYVKINCSVLNVSSKGSKHFYTLEIPTEEIFDRIELKFAEENFDLKVNVEGSQNLNDWVDVTKNSRILSINNELTKYQFTKLTFPDSKYRYLKLVIESKEKPTLKEALITKTNTVAARENLYPIKKFRYFEEKKIKVSVIHLSLGMPVPVNSVSLDVLDSVDYYRTFTLEFMVDSVKTDKGWLHQYQALKTGVLSSLEKNDIEFESTVLQQLKITIYNNDNEALEISKATAKGVAHDLLIRTTQEADYFLLYGRTNVNAPNYDLLHFKDKIPSEMNAISLGDEEKIDQAIKEKVNPLFENKLWLWMVMGVIILVLGWFSLRMMRKV